MQRRLFACPNSLFFLFCELTTNLRFGQFYAGDQETT